MNKIKQKLFLPNINGNTLKLIALLTMLIDHAAVVLIQNGILGGPYNYNFRAIQASAVLSNWLSANQVLRGIGRVSFPIYCFLLVEGFVHTRDVKKYGLRLLIFSLISEIPFDLAVFHDPFYLKYQNVFFTLFLGLVALYGVQAAQQEFLAGEVQDMGRRIVWLLKTAAAVAVCCGAAWLLKTDYDVVGVCLIVLFYMARENLYIQLFTVVFMLCWKPMAALSCIPICMYDGTRGERQWKYMFYAFYPVHLLILWEISMILFR